MNNQIDWEAVVASLQESAKEALENQGHAGLVVGGVLTYLALAFSKGVYSAKNGRTG